MWTRAKYFVSNADVDEGDLEVLKVPYFSLLFNYGQGRTTPNQCNLVHVAPTFKNPEVKSELQLWSQLVWRPGYLLAKHPLPAPFTLFHSASIVLCR